MILKPVANSSNRVRGMGIQEDLKGLVSGLNPWAPLFAFVGMFQLLRGATFDAIYFFGIVIVLLIDGWRIFPYELPNRPRIPLLSAVAFSALFGSFLLLTPKGSAIEVALMVGALLILVGLVWYKDSGPMPKASAALNRSKWLWIACGISVNLWELFSYLAGDLSGDNNLYPTISIIMTPIMSDPLGRCLSIAVWLMVGLLLIRSTTRSKS